MEHRDASYCRGTRFTVCRHTPRAASTGMSHVAKHHSTTAMPATSPRVASTTGARPISTIRAPATTQMN